MSREKSPESSTADDLDRMIIQALCFDVRIPFASLALILHVSEQTINRRFRRLVRDGLLRTIAMADGTGFGVSRWILRIVPTPGSGTRLAEVLAQHPDMSWVGIGSGGAEVIAVYRGISATAQQQVLGDQLPKTPLVQSLSLQETLWRYRNIGDRRGGHDIAGMLELFTATQLDALAELANPTYAVIDVRDDNLVSGAATHDPGDLAVISALSTNARLPFTAVAAATGLPAAGIPGRVERLVRSGLMYFDIDIHRNVFGYQRSAALFISCPPSDLETIGHSLLSRPEVMFVAVTTGATNLYAAVYFDNARHLHQFLIQLPPGLHVETVPIARQVKLGHSVDVSSGLRLLPRP